MLFAVGERPERGTYACSACGWRITLYEAGEALPPCASCGPEREIEYRKLR